MDEIQKQKHNGKKHSFKLQNSIWLQPVLKGRERACDQGGPMCRRARLFAGGAQHCSPEVGGAASIQDLALEVLWSGLWSLPKFT